MSRYTLVGIGKPIKICQLCGRDDRKTGCIIWKEGEGDFTICASHIQGIGGIQLCEEFEIQFAHYMCNICDYDWENPISRVNDVILPAKCPYCANPNGTMVEKPRTKENISWYNLPVNQGR